MCIYLCIYDKKYTDNMLFKANNRPSKLNTHDIYRVRQNFNLCECVCVCVCIIFLNCPGSMLAQSFWRLRSTYTYTHENYIFVSTYIQMYICVNVCIYIRLYVYICVCLYIYGMWIGFCGDYEHCKYANNANIHHSPSNATQLCALCVACNMRINSHTKLWEFFKFFCQFFTARACPCIYIYVYMYYVCVCLQAVFAILHNLRTRIVWVWAYFIYTFFCKLKKAITKPPLSHKIRTKHMHIHTYILLFFSWVVFMGVCVCVYLYLISYSQN